MLAMKCISARFDTHDKEDVQFLVDYFGLKKPDQVFRIISKYCPDHQIPAKAKFFVEEILLK
jgi:antitoxin component of RelBE/YafQ-DinJ toxin-antitoxin module